MNDYHFLHGNEFKVALEKILRIYCKKNGISSYLLAEYLNDCLNNFLRIIEKKEEYEKTENSDKKKNFTVSFSDLINEE